MPAALLGAVVLLAAVFVAGFYVGRGTAPEDDPATSVEVVLDDLTFPPLEQERFQRFRAPGNDRFGLAPERGPFGGRARFGERQLDLLCELLENDAIPEQAPFYDRLVDACADRG